MCGVQSALSHFEKPCEENSACCVCCASDPNKLKGRKRASCLVPHCRSRRDTPRDKKGKGSLGGVCVCVHKASHCFRIGSRNWLVSNGCTLARSSRFEAQTATRRVGVGVCTP